MPSLETVARPMLGPLRPCSERARGRGLEIWGWWSQRRFPCPEDKVLSCGLCWGAGGAQPVAGEGRPCPQKPPRPPLPPPPSPWEAKTGDLRIQVFFIYEECILVTVIKGHIKAELKTRMQPRGAQSVLGLFPSALGVAPGPRPTQSLHVSKGNSFEQRQFSQVITQNAQ